MRGEAPRYNGPCTAIVQGAVRSEEAQSAEQAEGASWILEMRSCVSRSVGGAPSARAGPAARAAPARPRPHVLHTGKRALVIH